MTTPSDIDAVEARLIEDEQDIVAVLKIEQTTHDLTRALMGLYDARQIRRSIVLGSITVKNSFTSKDGVRFVC